MNIRESYCVHCGELFACRRTTAKFCSNSCKMQYHRHGSLMKQKSKDAEYLLIEMLNLVHDSRHWHSTETLKMLENLEGRLTVLKARTKAGISGVHHRAK